jgi:hypothetical protein
LAPGAPRDPAAAFAELGRSIDRRWRSAHYSVAAFADLAAEELLKHDIAGRIGAGAVNRWVLGAEQLPQQEDPLLRFGEPPITLLRTRQFYISVLYWHETPTNTHEHGFSGALQVLDGASIESEYRARVTRELNESVQLVDLTRVSVDLFTVGTVHPIHSGEQYIHSVLHFERPSATIVVRTYEDQWARRQSFLLPSISYLPLGQAPVVERQLRLIDTLGAGDHAGCEALARLLDSPDPQVAVHAIHHLAARRGDPGDYVTTALAPLRSRDPEFGEALRDAYARLQAELELLRVRRRFDRPEHRFLLSAMMLAPDAPELRALVEARHPGQKPDQLVGAWTGEIAATLLKPPHARWAAQVVRSLLRGDQLNTTVQELRAAHPELSDEALPIIEDLHRRLPRTPPIDTLLVTAGRLLAQ